MHSTLVNFRRACVARVTVVVLSVYLSVCLFVCRRLFSHYSSLKKVFITESARNKDKYHSSHTHSTDCCLQRWLPISPRGPSGHRGDRKDWSRLWRRRKEWSGAPRPGPLHGGPSLPSGKLLLHCLPWKMRSGHAPHERGKRAYAYACTLKLHDIVLRCMILVYIIIHIHLQLHRHNIIIIMIVHLLVLYICLGSIDNSYNNINFTLLIFHV